MKNFFAFVVIFVAGLVSAQNVEDYPYVSVPIQFSDFKENQYSINTQLKILFKQKGYMPLGENRAYWPSDAKLNPCKVLSADVLNQSSFFTNKLALVLKDCNGSTVFEKAEETNIKEFEEGYSDILQKIMQNIQNCHAKDEVAHIETQEVTIITKTKRAAPNQEMLPESEKTKTTTSTQVIAKSSVIHSSKDLKISELENGEILVIDVKNSNIIAHFYPAQKQGIYHVKVKSVKATPYYTIGYKDKSGNLSYEQTQDHQTWHLIELN